MAKVKFVEGEDFKLAADLGFDVKLLLSMEMCPAFGSDDLWSGFAVKESAFDFKVPDYLANWDLSARTRFGWLLLRAAVVEVISYSLQDGVTEVSDDAFWKEVRTLVEARIEAGGFTSGYGEEE